MVQVIATEAFEEWYLDLAKAEQRATDKAVGLLGERGVLLGFPYSSAIVGASFPLRELRIQAKGEPLRVFYAFDADRQAVLLIGGNKTGDGRFYERLVRTCEKLWAEYVGGGKKP